MDVLLSFAIFGFVVWWFRHNQAYSAGLVDRPFFSVGAKGPKKRRRTVRRYPRAATSTATATPKTMALAVRKISTYTHNPEIAARLLQSTRKANMAQPLEWCVDKTIQDILRDRR